MVGHSKSTSVKGRSDTPKPSKKKAGTSAKTKKDDALNEALENSFPGSDPVSLSSPTKAGGHR